jgi:SAM-dependent methyltransferase
MDSYSAASAAVYDLMQQARGRSPAFHATAILDVVRARHPAAASLLDVACGTGAHLALFHQYFEDVAGVDASRAMLDHARRRQPSLNVHEGDMQSFDLGRTFDVATCLLSGIGYMLTVDDLVRALANMAAHLSSGGLLIVEPWLHPADWRVPYQVADAVNTAQTAVSRLSVNGREGHLSTFTWYWAIASDGAVNTFVEQHRMGLYTVAEYRAALAAAGLDDTHHDPKGPSGRGLFTAMKR